MKKVFDQTVRDIKRGVNKKVLKVPGIEQKVLDSTSNEPWGPHGTLLADIAQATRNYHEYQMIMTVIWKRINDTGKNWRHVYKALTVLEYLVAHGSERVIDEIREHSYQISTLSDFQYIDSSGRDQGSNVRKKSQSLVVLVNDKERIIEVRQKAAANRDKFRNASSGMYKPGSYSSSGGYGDRYDYDRNDGRYGSRDDDPYGYGKDREYNYRDDDRYGRNGDLNSRDGDRYGRDFEDRYSRDGFRDDDFRGRSRSVDGYHDDSRSRSADRYRASDDEGHSSSRGSGARVDDPSLDGRRIERKFSEQNIGAPPSYEEAVSESRSPARSERDGETSTASVPRAASPVAPTASAPGASSPPASQSQTQTHNAFGSATSPANQEVLTFDEFDPRASVPVGDSPNAAPTTSNGAAPATSNSAAPATSNSAEIDLLGSLSDSFSSNALAIMPAAPETSTAGSDAHANFGSVPSFAAAQPTSNVMNQSFEDPFGDSPFRAIPSTDATPAHQQVPASSTPVNSEMPSSATQADPASSFGDSFYGISYSGPSASNVQNPPNSQFLPQEHTAPQQQEVDILADILPPSGPSSEVGYSDPASQPPQPSPNMYGNFNMGPQQPSGPPAQFSGGNFNMGPQQPSGPPAQLSGGNFNMGPQQPSGPPAQLSGGNFNMGPQQPSGPPGQLSGGNFNMVPQQPSGPPAQLSGGNFNMSPQQPSGPPTQLTGGNFNMGPPSGGNFSPQGGSLAPVSTYMAPQAPATTAAQFNNTNSLPQGVPQIAHQTPASPAAQQNSNDPMSSHLSQGGTNFPATSQPSIPSTTGALAIVPQSQPAKEKFELKSAVWADTLSRGLVNLNISGPKTNPHSGIGVDFDSLNRKEKRMEKQPPQSAVTSTINMGKAMGSGSGMGRAAASTLRPPPTPMTNSSMGMGMGMGMGGGPGASMGMGMGGGPGAGMGMGMGGAPGGMGMGMGGYGTMGQQQSMGMGMGMNMGMGQGVPMQPQAGQPMPGGGYRPVMGTGGYTQQPYGGGYR